jgi:GTP-binding protein HflX
VLEELGIQQKDTLLVLNKVDALEDRSRLDYLLGRYPQAVPISAATGKGLDRLSAAVGDALSRTFSDVDIETSAGNGRLLAWLAESGHVLSRQYHEDRVTVHCRLPVKYLGRLQRDETAVVQPRLAPTRPTSEEATPMQVEDVA